MLDKKQLLLTVATVLVVIIFYREFIQKGDHAMLQDLNDANEKVASLRTQLQNSKQDLELSRDQVVRSQNAEAKAQERSRALESEMGSLRTVQMEQQQLESDLHGARQDAKRLAADLAEAKKLVEDEKLVGQKSEEGAAKIKILLEQTQTRLKEYEDQATGDERKHAQSEAALSEMRKLVAQAEAEASSARAEAQKEAEAVKELMDDLRAAREDNAVLRRQNKNLKKRADAAEQDTERLLQSGDRTQILDANRREQLEKALDPELFEPMEAVTWNIAAVNNNPFEYWIDGTKEYNELMEKIGNYVTEPGKFDVPVKTVFTQDMWEDLKIAMKEVGWVGVDKVDQMWENNFKKRKIISEFLKDPLIGKKRLASMPDRVTNTIPTTTGLKMRPTVINCYEGELGTMQKWWKAWLRFMFKEEVEISKKGRVSQKMVYETLKPIQRSKYPAVTEEEETISRPLQVLAGGIFDAILVHMMNTAAPSVWEDLRTEMCNKLNKGKNKRVVDILTTTYASADCVFLQEVSGDFEKAAKKSSAFPETFDMYTTDKADESRGQNSVILLKKEKFRDIEEVTPSVLQLIDGQAPIANGDLFVLSATSASGVPFLFASFHGDTNGLATKPIVAAVHKYALPIREKKPLKLVFGMDANSYEKPAADQLGIGELAVFYTARNLTTCYGDNPNPKDYTTFHARTHLQPQLNKAVLFRDRDALGDKNPKDNIMFFSDDFVAIKTTKDNTGERKYEDGMVFPTLTFPSDHGITSTTIRLPTAADRRKKREERTKQQQKHLTKTTEVLTWNIAAVNNNPFEYWITGTKEYNTMMEKLSDVISQPSMEFDVPVREVFTPDMWLELKKEMNDAGWNGLEEVASRWEDDFKNKNIVSGFLQDPVIGKKRLASMPDRVTNTITTATGLLMRPTVINCYEGDLSSLSGWWTSWKNFMFATEAQVAADKRVPVWKLLKKIKRSKYPAVTEDEERLSVPLQTLAQAVFDAVMVHIMNKVAGAQVWQPIRAEMCEKLNKKKNARVLDILQESYDSADIMFLQEVSSDFEKKFAARVSDNGIATKYNIHTSVKADSARNQNSVLLLRKGIFSDVVEVTTNVTQHILRESGPISDGDLMVTEAWKQVTGGSKEKYLLASFHGDTNGLATIPVVDAVVSYCKANSITRLLFGLDANTHAVAGPDVLDLTSFSRHLALVGLGSCYGSRPDPTNSTTFHARTHLQSQLNKAVSWEERGERGDRNPKDNILFFPSTFSSVRTLKDNTGSRVYKEGMVFPTLNFPSDHGITTAVLLEKSERPVFPPGRYGELLTATWNIAAVNNNPFEYWITGTTEYNKLMEEVGKAIADPDPQEDDVLVTKVFTHEMWRELKKEMQELTWPIAALSVTEAYWEEDLSKRRVISEFLKDKDIGKKRLASMPDRVTNTMKTSLGTFMRPTVINCYDGDLSTQERWWRQWKHFMFHTTIDKQEDGSAIEPWRTLKKIKRAKYPAVTKEEEGASLPLQVLAGAIFDAILVRVLNKAAPKVWETLRMEMCEKLNRNKDSSVASILDNQYYDQDVVFLQEVGAGLLAQPLLHSSFVVTVPEQFDSDRNQNSIILLKKHEWRNVREVTQDVSDHIESRRVENGDLVAITATRRENNEEVGYLLASFHGDTNGLATIPVVRALLEYSKGNSERLVIGMDANTYEFPTNDQQGFADFVEFFSSQGLASCYGDNPSPKEYTTFHARTHLQPQLNKAVALSERDVKGDKNPKDAVLFYKKDFKATDLGKDNTGRRKYVEEMVFPTLDFPSDHGVTRTRLSSISTAAAERQQLNRTDAPSLKVMSWDASPTRNPFEYNLTVFESSLSAIEEGFRAALRAGKKVDDAVPKNLVPELKEELKRVGYSTDAIDSRWVEIKEMSLPEYYSKRSRHAKVESLLASVGGVARPSALTCRPGGWEEWKAFVFKSQGNSTAPYLLIGDGGYGKEISLFGLAVLDAVYKHLFDAVPDQKAVATLRSRVCGSNSKSDRVLFTIDPVKSYSQIMLLQGIDSKDLILPSYHSIDVGHGCVIMSHKTKLENVTRLPSGLQGLTAVFKGIKLVLASVDTPAKLDAVAEYAKQQHLPFIAGAKGVPRNALTRDLPYFAGGLSPKTFFSTRLQESSSALVSSNVLFDARAAFAPFTLHNQMVLAEVFL